MSKIRKKRTSSASPSLTRPKKSEYLAALRKTRQGRVAMIRDFLTGRFVKKQENRSVVGGPASTAPVADMLKRMGERHADVPVLALEALQREHFYGDPR